MKQTKKYISVFILFLAITANISAQNFQADSVRILFGEIINAPADVKCKTFNVYKDAISEIPLDDLEVAISKVIGANSLFIEDKTNKNCPFIKPITQLQAILHKLTPEDTSSLINALAYAKSKFSGYVNVQLKFSTITNPSVSVQSYDPFVFPFNTDSLTAELYILPEKKYYVTVSRPGYDSITTQIISDKDTVVSISLKESEIDIIEPDTPGKRSISLWWIPVTFILGILIAMAGSKFIKNKSLKKDNEESVKRLNEKLQNQEVLINKYVSEIELLRSKKSDHGSKPSSGKYFLTEFMLTAGPRKKMNVDRDLGEDVSGIVMNYSEALIWLMDGSSDFFDPLLHPETKREYFSSRLLAQSLGRKLRHQFISERSVSIESVFAKIINEVKEEWLSAINLLPDSEKTILRKNLMDGIQPDCAATVLIARLTIGGDLKVYRTGDSKLLSFTGENGNLKVDTTLSVKNDVIGPVSFLLNLNKNKFDILIRQSKPEITERNHIHSVIGYSDGIGKASEKTLIKDYPSDPEKARTEIISQLQGTGDDKSLFIVDIREV